MTRPSRFAGVLWLGVALLAGGAQADAEPAPVLPDSGCPLTDAGPPPSAATTAAPPAANATPAPAMGETAAVTQEPAAATAQPAAAEVTFTDWLAGFQAQAITCGLAADGPALAALAEVTHEPAVARFDRAQPEYNSTFSDYLARRVTAGVIERGRALAVEHKALLARLQADAGVPAAVLLALWALESAYGDHTGDTPVFSALATLAHESRRRDFYQRELLGALRLVETGAVTAEQLRGSWAGALGQMQFMPTTLATHGRDGDGDGRLDPWASVADALTSAAGYLAALGWQRGQPWGREVVLPAGFDPRHAEVGDYRLVGDWSAAGLRLATGAALPAVPTAGAVVLPSGYRGPAFLVYANFDRLLDWNRSLFYALTVGVLADRLAGGPPLVGRAPPKERPLGRAEVIAMQQALDALGFPAGAADGMVGAQTRAALRGWQVARGLPADGYPTPGLIARILAAAGVPAAALPAPDPAAIRALQQGLNRLGYAAGAEDGVPGGQTRRALAAWLAARGLPPVAAPDLLLIGQVGEEAAALEAASGTDGVRGD